MSAKRKTLTFNTTKIKSMYGEGTIINPPDADSTGGSFIVSAHNEQRYLPATIRALRHGIQQLELIAEIIVINDTSTDDTGKIATELGARVIDVSLRNIGAVRNAGAAAAKYPWLIFVDADTIVPSGTIQQSLKTLADGFAGGGAHVEIPNRYELFFVKRWMYYAVVIVWQYVFGWAAGCYMFCRKEYFDSFGGFDEQYYAAEELFFSQQLKNIGEFRLVRPPVLTSARKLKQYSVWELSRFLLVPLTQPFSLFQSTKGLEILYEDER